MQVSELTEVGGSGDERRLSPADSGWAPDRSHLETLMDEARVLATMTNDLLEQIEEIEQRLTGGSPEKNCLPIRATGPRETPHFGGILAEIRDAQVSNRGTIMLLVDAARRVRGAI